MNKVSVLKADIVGGIILWGCRFCIWMRYHAKGDLYWIIFFGIVENLGAEWVGIWYGV